MCVAGLRALAAAGPPGGGTGRRPGGARSPTGILADLGDCVHRSGRWQRAPDDDAGRRRPAAAGDPRRLARRRSAQPGDARAVLADLAEDGYVYRFRHDARPLGEAEGAFLLCGFWVAPGCVRLGAGRRRGARWFERNRSACGPPGLYDRGVRRPSAAAPRQHAASLRARRDAGVRSPVVDRTIGGGPARASARRPRPPPHPRSATSRPRARADPAERRAPRTTRAMWRSDSRLDDRISLACPARRDLAACG